MAHFPRQNNPEITNHFTPFMMLVRPAYLPNLNDRQTAPYRAAYETDERIQQAIRATAASLCQAVSEKRFPLTNSAIIFPAEQEVPLWQTIAKHYGIPLENASHPSVACFPDYCLLLRISSDGAVCWVHNNREHFPEKLNLRAFGLKIPKKDRGIALSDLLAEAVLHHLQATQTGLTVGGQTHPFTRVRFCGAATETGLFKPQECRYIFETAPLVKELATMNSQPK